MSGVGGSDAPGRAAYAPNENKCSGHAAAARREGEAMAKREQTIKMAEANKAFSHFAW